MKKLLFILSFSLISFIGFSQTEVKMDGSVIAGTIAVIKTNWSQVSGPATPTIVDPSDLKTKITGFNIPGVYVFRLTVTDAEENVSVDEMTVTVNQKVAPKARAGSSVILKLPTK